MPRELSPYASVPDTMRVRRHSGCIGKYPGPRYAPLEMQCRLSRFQMILTAGRRASRKRVRGLRW